MKTRTGRASGRVLAAIVCWLAAADSIAHSAAVEDQANVVKQLLDKWSKARELGNEFRCEAVKTTSWKAPSKLASRDPNKTEYAIKISWNNALQSVAFHQDGGREERLTAVNSEYCFRLLRFSDKSPWTLKYFTSDKNFAWNELEADAFILNTYWLYLEGKYLPDLLQTSEFHLDSIDSDPVSQTWQINFHCDEMQHGNQPWWVKKGIIIVNQDRYATIQGITLESEQNGVQSTSNIVNTYRADNEGRPILVDCTVKNNHGTTQKTGFRNAAYGPIPAQEFTLEAFGIKYGAASQPSSWTKFIALNVAAVIMLAAAATLIIKQRWTQRLVA